MFQRGELAQRDPVLNDYRRGFDKKEKHMRQEVQVTNEVNAEGNPTGGRATGLGIDIRFQEGPLGNPPDMANHNGAFVEGIIEVAKQRLDFFQSASDAKFACAENAEAIEHLDLALAALDKRTARRKEAGTEGTHTPDAPPAETPAAEAPAPVETPASREPE